MGAMVEFIDKHIWFFVGLLPVLIVVCVAIAACCTKVKVDPYLLDEIPLDDPQNHLPLGWEERVIRKRNDDLFEGFAELERQIESSEVPECCAGYWGLFGCHRPDCLSSKEGG